MAEHERKGYRSRRKPGTTDRARNLRQGDNLAEGRLWNELKDRKLGGYKFVRQLPIGPYFADFACRARRLVVELDGSQHADRAYDRARDAFMQESGYSVMRFWSHEARSQTRAVCETILAALDGHLEEAVIAPDLRFSPAVPLTRHRKRRSEAESESPPHRLATLGTSPPLNGGEEGR